VATGRGNQEGKNQRTQGRRFVSAFADRAKSQSQKVLTAAVELYSRQQRRMDMNNLVLRCTPLALVACLLAGCAATDTPRATTTTTTTTTTMTTTTNEATTRPHPPATADAIDGLVERLSSSHGLWLNGAFADLGLPRAASMQQVVSRVFEMTGFDAGRVKEHRILETRQVRIAGSLPDEYTAVLVETDMGRKIVLLQYQGERARGMWWSRVYDAELPR
jgi:hypothetical protein